jgi:hypothetical protein
MSREIKSLLMKTGASIELGDGATSQLFSAMQLIRAAEQDGIAIVEEAITEGLRCHHQGPPRFHWTESKSDQTWHAVVVCNARQTTAVFASIDLIHISIDSDAATVLTKVESVVRSFVEVARTWGS